MDSFLFILAGLLTYLMTQLLADVAQIRLFFHERKLKLVRRIDLFNATHVHHYIYGILLIPLAFAALTFDSWLSSPLFGVATVLIGSELGEIEHLLTQLIRL